MFGFTIMVILYRWILFITAINIAIDRSILSVLSQELLVTKVWGICTSRSRQHKTFHKSLSKFSTKFCVRTK